MPHEVADATRVAELVAYGLGPPLVGEGDAQTRIQERHHLQPLGERLGSEFDVIEHRGVGLEGDDGASIGIGRGADVGQLADRLAAVAEQQAPTSPLAVDDDLQLRGQGVDDGHADAVQAAGHLVTGAAELAPCMQHGQHDLGS